QPAFSIIAHDLRLYVFVQIIILALSDTNLMTGNLAAIAAYTPPVHFLPRLGITAAIYVVVIFGGGFLFRALTRPLGTGDSHPAEEPKPQLRKAGMNIEGLGHF